MNIFKRTARRYFLRGVKPTGPNRFRAVVKGDETLSVPTKNCLKDLRAANEPVGLYAPPVSTQVPGSRRRRLVD